VTLTSRALRWLGFGASRYARKVSWKHRISIVVLAVVAALPVSRTVCTMLCDSSAATRAAHHGSRKSCEEQTTSPSGLQILGASEHDCSSHEAGIRQTATTTPSRADGLTAPSLWVAGRIYSAIRNLLDSDAASDYRPPPGSIPLTASPLVLRV
jgi:hypothetical protein